MSLDIRKILENFFLTRVVKHWNRKVVGVPFPETSKVRLDSTLSNLMWLKMPLLIAGGLD